LLGETVGRFALLTVLSILLMTPIALAASAGRGYLPAIGAVLLTIFFGQGLATVGVGAWFPWAIPALAVGAVDPHPAIGPASYLLVVAVSLAGGYLTIQWWRVADHG
jgi:ABC-2 type transport system permease protein